MQTANKSSMIETSSTHTHTKQWMYTNFN